MAATERIEHTLKLIKWLPATERSVFAAAISLTLATLIGGSPATAAERPDSLGKDFWITFPQNYVQTPQLTLFISSPSISSGSSYTLASGGTISGGTAFHGLYTSGTLSGASTLQSVSVSSMVTTVGNVSTGMGGGGGMGGRP